jgi:hypothetical protein
VIEMMHAMNTRTNMRGCRPLLACAVIVALTAVCPARADDAAAPAADPGSAQGCGRISDFDVAPRQKSLHAAKIIAIDGAVPGPQGSRSYRVSAGAHTLTIGERIESRYLSMNDIARNTGSTPYKKLVVDVPPNTLTLIAARLNEDNNRGGKWQNGAYWDPVAWQQTAENCR